MTEDNLPRTAEAFQDDADASRADESPGISVFMLVLVALTCATFWAAVAFLINLVLGAL